MRLHALAVVLGWSSVAVLAVLVTPDLALASSNPFAEMGSKLMDIGSSLVEDLGVAVTFVGAAWAVLAHMGKVGHIGGAITCFLCGVFLTNLRSFVEFLFA